MEMMLLRIVHRTLQHVELSSCRLLRRLEWRRSQLVHQRAHHSSSCLGFLLMSEGYARCHDVTPYVTNSLIYVISTLIMHSRGG
jgi:hypothetical protein